MSIKMQAPYCLSITSYEINESGSTPTLTHLFWGENIETAAEIAKAHLKSDTFFSSTFVGKMDWKEDQLVIEYDGQIYSLKNVKNKKIKLNKILKELENEGVKINKQQKRLKILQLVQQLSNK